MLALVRKLWLPKAVVIHLLSSAVLIARIGIIKTIKAIQTTIISVSITNPLNF
ncbi:hypothetical protein [Helicobacter apodemus]|uniref:hypothetical protein n=1 Tax=Helicobacter apodemus TaxID=135569 RepID=UPI0013A574EF|nr:hypothetical protein [Helicobacter apodemus]